LKRLCNVFIFAVLLQSAACMRHLDPSPYQKRGVNEPYGYFDVSLKDNLYFIEVSCNSGTSSSIATQYLYRRAKELCEENGYQNYRVTNQVVDEVRERRLTFYGLPPFGIATYIRPRVTGYVECLEKSK
jgi:hypothetical protein